MQGRERSYNLLENLLDTVFEKDSRISFLLERKSCNKDSVSL